LVNAIKDWNKFYKSISKLKTFLRGTL
jgi:hypothetical protein